MSPGLWPAWLALIVPPVETSEEPPPPPPPPPEDSNIRISLTCRNEKSPAFAVNLRRYWEYAVPLWKANSRVWNRSRNSSPVRRSRVVHPASEPTTQVPLQPWKYQSLGSREGESLAVVTE